jgi:hypothetical protein
MKSSSHLILVITWIVVTCLDKSRAGDIYDDMWVCLMAGSDKASCEQQKQPTTCVWCAEPVFGLCVPPNAAAKMNYLPFFKCDMNNVK